MSVSGDGDTLLVGAPLTKRVYVYTRSGTTWSLEDTITPPLSVWNNNDYNGADTSISTDGNTIVISAHQYADGAGNTIGAVSIHRRSGTTWTQTQTIVNPVSGLNNIHGAHHDGFGRSVAMSADSNVIAMSNVSNSVFMYNYEIPP